MKYILLLTLLLFLLPCFSQDYSYMRYDVNDGLAGSNVYCITQDKEGFLWMGTEGGLSRFDGVHFSNFTLKDGLPDIEVLQIMADSRERIWMGPFSQSVCYYYQGRIHNQENDTLLKKIHIRSGILNFAEDKEGNILIHEFDVLHLVTAKGIVRDFDSIQGKPIDSYAVSRGADGHFLVQDRDEIYRFDGKVFTPFFPIDFGSENSNFIILSPQVLAWQGKQYGYRYRLASLKLGKTFDFDAEKNTMLHVSFSVVSDSAVYRNSTRGTREYNLFTGKIRDFSIGARISRTFRDDEGNLWFTSLGQGVFRLNSENIRNIKLMDKYSASWVPLIMRRIDDQLLVGGSNSMLYRCSLSSPEHFTAHALKYSGEANEIRYLEKTKDGRLLVGSSMRLFYADDAGGALGHTIKTACLRNDSELLAGGAHGVMVYDVRTLHVKDTLFRQRATFLCYQFDTLYIGTIHGLYAMGQDNAPVYKGTLDPLFRKRISSIILSPDSTLWVATYGGGTIGWKGGRRLVTLSRSQGLSSDLCRVLALQGHTLWIGTDKGLNKVDIADPEYPVAVYRASDGLSSDIINTIYADSSVVCAGTPAGLSFFDPGHPGMATGCKLALLSVSSSGKERLADTASLRLSYKSNNIRWEFAGISYRSAGNIFYRYRLLGLDSNWTRTKESFLDYPTLPSGDYELQLLAVNKFGVESPPLSVRFSVAAPFWKTTWFDVLTLVLFLGFTWLFVALRIKHLRRRQAEQDELQKRLAETEHMALQAQMNPHFIFNCLNSIQQYIFDQDIFAVNKYITGFAKLIRATLHNSSKPSISLAEEIEYLSTYLSLEKLRFKEKMDYTIDVAPSLRRDMENIQMPPMLIQPYVENSMRHGLRHKTGRGGYIRIKVMQEGDKLMFVIEDNGIGRQQAARYKTGEHIEYQSRGMSLTADRIRLINMTNGDSIRVEVFDISDQLGQAAGTRVTVWFPRYPAFQKEAYDGAIQE